MIIAQSHSDDSATAPCMSRCMHFAQARPPMSCIPLVSDISSLTHEYLISSKNFRRTQITLCLLGLKILATPLILLVKSFVLLKITRLHARTALLGGKTTVRLQHINTMTSLQNARTRFTHTYQIQSVTPLSTPGSSRCNRLQLAGSAS